MHGLAGGRFISQKRPRKDLKLDSMKMLFKTESYIQGMNFAIIIFKQDFIGLFIT